MAEAFTRSTRPERRRDRRINVRGRINGRLLPLNAAVTVLDMSSGGFAMQTRGVFSIGALHEFRLTAGKGISLRLSARVVHGRRVQDVMGSVHNVSGLAFVVDTRGRLAVQEALEVLRRESTPEGA